jgi:hypothetical protein
MSGQVVLACAEAPPPTKKGKWDAEALEKTGMARAARSASVRGHRQGFKKVMADRLLANVEAGASNQFLLVVRQSFNNGPYSPLIGMEEIEWQIMLEQFIASGVVAKDEVINIDSVDVSYVAPQAHKIINVALHREYSPGIVFIFS